VNTASPAKPVLSLPDEARRARDLLAQIGWFNRLRLLAAAVVIWLTGMATHVLDLIEDPWPLYLLGALIAFVDGCYMLLYPRLSTMRVGSVRAHVFVQIAIDLLILTALLHHTGGITNPLVMFYMFHAFIAALVLSVVAAYVVAGCSLLLVTLLGWAERAGALEHHPLRLGLMDLSQVTPLGFLLLLLAYGMTMAFSIYFVGTVLAALRAGEKQLVRLGRSLAMSEKLASVGTLAAGVSHEINNPVGVINNKVQILRYRIEDGDGREQLLGELDVIEKHTRRIGQITAGLLTFSRETPFELQRVDLRELVQEASDLVRVPYQAASVELAVDPGRVAVVRGSPNHLLQVLINILLNAKDASPGGAVVRLRWRSKDREVAIEIVDDGSGMSEAVVAKAFDPFFTTKDVDKGTGLGLAISHGIVERHGGRIEVESVEGRGSTFRVILPGWPTSDAKMS
jgi:signal transduction histidine kinase